MNADLKTAIGPSTRYDRVAAAYDGMTEANRESFQRIIQDPAGYPHAQVARALREIGYEVDRKQVQYFRERLGLGKVAL